MQGFPDDFIFEHGCGTGPREARSVYPRVRRQIGNAVPPPSASVIVGAMADLLLSAGVMPRGARELATARRYARRPSGGRQAIARASGQ